MDLLSPTHREDRAILEDLAVMDIAIDKLRAFDSDDADVNDAVVEIDLLSVEQRSLALANPPEFMESIRPTEK